MTFARRNIEQLAPYVPGEQPRQGPVVKLNTNENPYPPAPQVLKAIADVSAESLRRYPPPRADRFREIAAQVHGVKPDQILATNGGDELLRMAVTAFCEPRGSGTETRGGLGETLPTYSLYDVLANIQDTPVVRVPLTDDWAIANNFATALNDAGCRLALIVNPHAPSGHLETLDRLAQIARDFRGVLLIDEAYTNFAAWDALPLVTGGAGNVLLLRTLSKGYSLAGLRFGYAIGAAGLIAALDKVCDSYNTDALAQAAAAAALENRAYAQTTWQAVIKERERMTAELNRRRYSTPPSQSNFVLATARPGGPAAKAIYESLKLQGILVRYFDQERLRDKLRITIGTPEQNTALLAALDRLPT